MDTLEGTAAEPFFELTMTAAGVSRVARSGSPPVLLLPGKKTRVKLDLKGAVLAPNVDEEGTFDAMLERGVGQLFLDHAPGPHVKVRIHGVRLDAGTPLCVSGEIERASTAGEGYRGAGVPVPASIAVQRLAAGPDAKRALAKLEDAAASAPAEPEAAQAPRARRPPVIVASVFGMLGLGAIGAMASRARELGALIADPGAASGWVAGFGALGAMLSSIAIFAAVRARFLPDLRSRGEGWSGTGWRTRIGWIHGTCLVFFGSFIAVFSGVLVPMAQASQLAAYAFALVAAVGLYAVLALAIPQRRALRRLWRLALTQPAKAPAAWGALDGRVVGGSTTRIRSHFLKHREVRQSDGTMRASSTWHFTDNFVGSTLEVALAAGGTLRVHTGEAVFAAEDTYVRTAIAPDDDAWGNDRGDELVEEIGAGDFVRVVARASGAEGAWEARSTGKDSLFVFGSRARPARAAAMRALSLNLLALTALAAITLMASYLAIAAI